MKSRIKDFWGHFGKIEHLWLIVILLFGLVMVFRMPPFQVMDEYKHFFKAYSVSEGNLVCQSNDQGRAGVFLPYEAKYAGVIMGVENIEYRYDKKVTIEEIERGTNITMKGPREFTEHAFCETPFWSSLPQAMGIGVAKILQFDLLTLFYTGRLFALLAAIGILYAALRILPIGRIFFMTVTLLPMFVQQIASYSLDGMHYALLFLFVAYVLRLALVKETIEKNDILLLAGLSVIGIYAKFGYMLFVLLIFLIPRKKFSSKKKYIMTMSGIFFIHLIAFFGLRALFSVGDLVDVGSINRGQQVLWILTHPVEYFGVFMTSIDTHFMFYIRNIFGVLGWLDYTLHGAHYLAIGVLLFFLVGSRHEEKVTLSNTQRSLLLGVAIVSGVLLMTILYIIDDPVGAPIIAHMQGKYFVPLLPLVLLGVYNMRLSERAKGIILLVFTLLTLPAVWFTQQSRYYDTTSIDMVPRNSSMVVRDVDAKHPLQQQFYVRENNLQGISFWIANPMQPESSLTFQLRDADCVKIIDRTFLRSREIPVPGYYHYRFPLIENSANSQFCLQVFPSLEVSDIPLKVEVSGSKIYKDGSLRIGSEAVDGDLAMIFHFGR